MVYTTFPFARRLISSTDICINIKYMHKNILLFHESFPHALFFVLPPGALTTLYLQDVITC